MQRANDSPTHTTTNALHNFLLCSLLSSFRFYLVAFNTDKVTISMATNCETETHPNSFIFAANTRNELPFKFIKFIDLCVISPGTTQPEHYSTPSTPQFRRRQTRQIKSAENKIKAQTSKKNSTKMLRNKFFIRHFAI